MTFEDRVNALAYLRFTPRQTRFLVTVALHGGFCMRRQFAAFAGIEYGKNVRQFLDDLVARQVGRRLLFEVNRGHVYQLTSRAVYRAIDQEDNRNRRVTSAALIARKLMLLDYVLSQPADEWFATEDDKVAFCRHRLQVSLALLPRRLYIAGDAGHDPAARYFVDKLPIFLAGTPATVHFVFLATEQSTQRFERFLADHRGLFTRLSRWIVVLVFPTQTVDPRSFRRTFEDFIADGGAPRRVTSIEGLRWYFETRRAVEQDNLPTVSANLIERYQRARRRFTGAQVESLYAEWTAQGDNALDSSQGPTHGTMTTSGALALHELPFTYAQFGTHPGVA